MRVLMLHNRYRALGGEERAVAAQVALLERHGHRVALLERDSAGVARSRAARGILGGGLDPEDVAAAVRRVGADVVHAHNLHPLLGWRALAAAQRAGAVTLLQLHNFRLFCAIGIAYRDAMPCHDCHGQNTLPGVIHRCRGPRAEAAIYAAGIARQQRRLLAHSDRLIALSEGHLKLLATHGLVTARASIVPNFVAADGWAERSGAAGGGYALVAGRLVEEKGFDSAIRAAAGAGVPLVVAGDGPDADRLRAIAAAAGGEVDFRGWVGPRALAALTAAAAVVLVPSRCEESFGYGALDAAAAGVPVLAAARGGLRDLVTTIGGTLLDPDDQDAWTAALARLWADPRGREAAGDRALAAARARYGESAALAALIGAYTAAGAC